MALEARPFLVKYSESAAVWLPANPIMLDIARLYLEKYETLESADRELYREILKQFQAGVGRWIDNATIEAAG